MSGKHAAKRCCDNTVLLQRLHDYLLFFFLHREHKSYHQTNKWHRWIDVFFSDGGVIVVLLLNEKIIQMMSLQSVALNSFLDNYTETRERDMNNCCCSRWRFLLPPKRQKTTTKHTTHCTVSDRLIKGYFHGAQMGEAFSVSSRCCATRLQCSRNGNVARESVKCGFYSRAKRAKRAANTRAIHMVWNHAEKRASLCYPRTTVEIRETCAVCTLHRVF